MFLFYTADILGLSPTLFSSMIAIAGLTLVIIVVLIVIAVCILVRDIYFTKKVLNDLPLRYSQSLEKKTSTITRNVYVEHDICQHRSGTDTPSSYV